MIPEIKQRITQLNNGEVPNGYEKTDLGIFPCEWIQYSIGEVSIDKGKYGINAPACEYKEGLPRYLRITDIDDDGCYIDNSAYVDHANSNEYVLNENDLVFARTGASVGKSYLYKKQDGLLVYAGFLIKFSIDPNKCNAYIVKKNCVSTKFEEWVQIMSARSGQPGINAEEYAEYRFVAPKSTIEQSRIAEILMKWDEAIELREKHIAALESKKEAILQRLVVKNDGWKKVKLKDILIERSIFATKEDGYPHVTLSKAGVNKKTDRYNRDFLVKSDDKKYKITYPNDICYNPANLKFGVICVNKFPEEAIFSPIYVTYEVSEMYNVDFIGAILCSNNFINYIRKYEEGTVYERQAVKSEDFLRGEIWVPSSKAEQDRIADVIHKINDYVDLVQQELETLQLQRKTLQQYLLNGIVRV